MEELQPATLLKVTLFPGCFSRFFNFMNGTVLHEASRLIKIVCKHFALFESLHANNRK